MRADFLMDYDVVTVEQEQRLYLLARLIAGPAPDDGERRPLNLSLVIDRSGSMAGHKIDYTRQAAQLLVQNLGSDDTFSMVLYNENVETVLPPQHVIHKDLLSQRISEIKAGGTTNLSSGWLEGVRHVQEKLTTQDINRVILMSDGLANRGITDTQKLVDIARQKFEGGVSTTTMGLGEDFNEDLLMAIADAGGGAFYFIESPEVTPSIFQEELRGLLSVVGQNLIITITPTKDVVSVRQMNAYPEERKGIHINYRLGDVFGEEVKSLLLELEIPALKQIGQVQIATLRFEYEELTTSGTEHRTMEMPVSVNVAPAEIGSGQENEEVTRSVILLKSAEARKQAIKLADEGKYGEAAKILRDAAEAIRGAGIDDEILKEERNALIAQAADMDKGTEFYQSYSRKSMSTQAYSTLRGDHENTSALRIREQQRKESGSNQEPEPPATPPQEKKVNDSGERITGFYNVAMSAHIRELAQKAKKPVSTGKPPTHLRWGEQLFALEKDLIRIGRAPQNEIVIDTTGISRFHCQIKRENGQLILEDLGSTNGTHVSGTSLTRPHVLQDGDIVFLCDQRITFEAQT